MTRTSGSQLPGPLSSAVFDLCNRVQGQISSPLAAKLAAVAEMLDAPLRVAVVGRVSSGKSTMVNALLRRRVATTDFGECTRVVTTYRYDASERVVAYRGEQPALSLPLAPDGSLPVDQLDGTGLTRLDVFLSNDTLESFTVIDTPGLSSLNRVDVDDEQAFALDHESVFAAAEGEILVFTLNDEFHDDELLAIRAFHSARGIETSSRNAIGVLTKADKVGGGSDSLDAADELARSILAEHRAEVLDIVPVVGLLAESGEAGALTEADADALEQLARSTPPDLLETMMLSPDLFTAFPSDVPEDSRKRLLRLLDTFGVKLAIRQVRDGSTAAQLNQLVVSSSGIERLRTLLSDHVDKHRDALKADAALLDLERVSLAASDPQDEPSRRMLQREIEQLSEQQEFHALNEVRLMRSLLRGDVTLPQELRDEVNRVFSGATVEERLGVSERTVEAVAAARSDALARWRDFELRGGPKEADAARTVIRSYQILAKQARAALTG